MEIRLAKTSDVNEILKLGNLVEEFKVSKKVVTFWPKKILLNIIKSKFDFLIVAEESNEIKGFIIVNFSPVFKKATIENIFVVKEFRGKKLAEKLLSSAIKELKKLKCEYVCSIVETDNPKSMKFFKKSDFNRGIDCVWMDKVLSSSFKEKY
ncbi:GNAT family N-acetyltransferase [archaeon]|jgi:ribosomal protein S18 acetylase RimI-like enzyme|nr:GNAT family N-acetyltransferase [archaeon]MBT4416606.1 GNAT family N-acetyltransferase [archaeon]